MKKRIILSLIACAVLGFFFWPQYPHPDAYEVKDFPLIEQPDQITCGPTSATMLLQKYGKQVTLDEVKSKTKTQWFKYKGQPVGMTYPEYISVAMTHFGVKSRMKCANLDELKHYVSQDRPCVVLVRSGDIYWHYVVVIGYDDDNIIVADPGWGKSRVMPVNDFMGAWNFDTDMNGKSVFTPCPTCKGTGRWGHYDFGPFSRCGVCDGDGNQPDVLASLLKTAEVHPRTLIVPSISLDNSGG